MNCTFPGREVPVTFKDALYLKLKGLTEQKSIHNIKLQLSQKCVIIVKVSCLICDIYSGYSLLWTLQDTYMWTPHLLMPWLYESPGHQLSTPDVISKMFPFLMVDFNEPIGTLWGWNCNLKFVISKLTCIKDTYLGDFRWNYPHANATEPHQWLVNIGSGNGLVLSGNKPLPEQMLAKIYGPHGTTRPGWVKLGLLSQNYEKVGYHHTNPVKLTCHNVSKFALNGMFTRYFSSRQFNG